MLGKIAEMTGKPIAVPDFEDIEDMTEWTEQQLKKHNLKGEENVLDVTRGRYVDNVATGNRFYMKLHHTAESKGQGRGSGGYSLEDAPAKGGASGSKRVSMLDVNALLSHGATETIRDASLIRGQKNEEYWTQFMQGHTPTEPKVPLVYEKFVNSLKAAGINVVSKGQETNVMAMTNSDVRQMAGDRVIRTGETVRFDKNMDPIPGGLFDPKLTGGHNGRQWSKIELPEPMLNPVMEEPARRLLGLTQQQLRDTISGEHTLGRYGKGPQAIVNALGELNVDKELEVARAQVNGSNKASRDQAIRRLGYLKAAQKYGLHPKEWVLDAVPVLPPVFRPVSVMGSSGIPLVSDPNYLYKELLEATSNFNSMKGSVGADNTGSERLAIYDSFKAVTGLGDPIQPKLVEKNVSGILKSIFGNSPKFGTVQRKLLSSTVDNVGRSVIIPNPDFDMDTVGIPEGKAFEVYDKFITRRLKRLGMPMGEALRHVKDKSELARKMLEKEMDERPVFINRAPVLHRFGIMAFRPKLVTGDTMQISPLIVKGFNADFDGDAMQFHVPTSEAAVREAYDRMMPSKNLLHPADFKSPVHAPVNEYISGLYHASSQTSERRPRVFASKKDAIAAYKRGDIQADDPVEIIE
jgi:DNA-directed RNA polymerase beta' subunit